MIKKFNTYLMFLYPIFLVLPDICVRIVIINLRFDDLFMYFLFFLNIKKICNFKKYYKPYYFFVLYGTIVFIAICSLAITTLKGYPSPSNYMVARLFGGLPMFIVMPVLLSDKDVRSMLGRGALIACVIYFLSIFYYRLSGTSASPYAEIEAERSDIYKSSFSPRTLNINGLTVLGTMVAVFAMDYFFERKKLFFIPIIALPLLIPFIIFSRANSIAIVLICLFFAIFSRKSPYLKFSLALLMIVGFITFIALVQTGNQRVKSAFDIDLKSGKGTSGRSTLWKQGIELIKWSKGYGWGFATEPFLFRTHFNGLVSHNLYIHIAVELGVHTLILYLSCLIYIMFTKYKAYTRTGHKFYLFQCAILFGFFCSCMFDHMMYFKKAGFLIFLVIIMPNVHYIREQDEKKRKQMLQEQNHSQH